MVGQFEPFSSAFFIFVPGQHLYLVRAQSLVCVVVVFVVVVVLFGFWVVAFVVVVVGQLDPSASLF